MRLEGRDVVGLPFSSNLHGRMNNIHPFFVRDTLRVMR